MRFPRVTIRRLLLLVAVLAVLLSVAVALQRRGDRFRRRAAECRAAIRSVYFADIEGMDGGDWSASVAGYHDDLAAEYEAAAKRPWLPFHPDPPPHDSIRAFWFAHEAVMKAYPGLVLREYNALVTVDDSPDPPVWAVRYRRRDSRSGLTVYLKNPVQIEVHNDGPPPAPE